MEESRVNKIGWKRNRRKGSPIVLSVLLLILAVIAASWEEESDNVNVISVENLDAFLGLRMITELNLKNLTAPEKRSRREIEYKKKLCGTSECVCYLAPLAVSCKFHSVKVLDLANSVLPDSVEKINISNLFELKVIDNYRNNYYLDSLVVTDVNKITIGNGWISVDRNQITKHVEIRNCRTLVIEDYAFEKTKNLNVIIDNCNNVILKKFIFPETFWLRINNVSNLEMDSSSFNLEMGYQMKKGIVDIEFNSVKLKIIPSSTFKMSGAKITFSNSSIDVIDREAFRALQLESVHFHNVKIGKFEREAFSVQTTIRDVTFDGVQVEFMAKQMLSAATNLTIKNSSIMEISDEAFYVSTAFLRLINNIFWRMGRHAFAIHSWNSIVISGNEFELLKQDTFQAPFSKVENVTNELIFSDNIVTAAQVNSLSFVPKNPELNVIIRNNTFQENCHCHLESWILTLSDNKWKSFYETSNCRISEFGSCYNLEGEYMTMMNYTEMVCNQSDKADCNTRSVSGYDFPSEIDLKNTERTILGVIFLGVACSVIIMLLILLLSWIRQKGICSKLGRFFTPSDPCCFSVCNSGNLVTSSSISRINIHEYAEIQYQMTEVQKQTILTMNGGAEEDVMVFCEDKATQTLPEELTQELLQSLREKLDDPENYNEARNMIEHLYDLIKVEESCNNNNGSRTSLHLDEEEEEDEEEDVEAGSNVYDVITKKPRKTSKKVRKNSTSNVRTTGTRAPSPDKLSPVAFNLPRATVVNEYAEPRDRKSNEYYELPGSREPVMPDVLAVPVKGTTHIYALPSRRMENRPLPSRPGTSDETS